MRGPTPTSSRPKIKLVAPPPPATASSSAAPWTAGPAAPAEGPGHVPHGMFFCRERRRDGKKKGWNYEKPLFQGTYGGIESFQVALGGAGFGPSTGWLQGTHAASDLGPTAKNAFGRERLS